MLPARAATIGKTGLDSDRLARIPARMQEFVDKGTLSGVVTLVARHGEIALHSAVGFQDIETKKPMAKDSIFQIMSMTKPVVSVAVMICAEEGKLAINDPVERYLPEYRGQWMVDARDGEKTMSLKKPARPITLRDLLTHTSGMPTQPPRGIADLYARMDLTLAEAVRVYSQQPLDFEPGTKWQYSNMGIDTLGRIVEVVSGKPFEKFIEERIFVPLGMKDSFIFAPADKTSRIALVHTSQNGKIVRAPGQFYGGDSSKFRKGAVFSAPSYGLYSTATDLFAFYQMMLNGGTLAGKRILSTSGVAALSSVQTGEIKTGHSPGAGFGLAWEVMKDPMATTQLWSVGSFGHGGAFGTHGWIDKDKDLVGVFLIQSAGGGDGAFAKSAFIAMASASVGD